VARFDGRNTNDRSATVTNSHVVDVGAGEANAIDMLINATAGGAFVVHTNGQRGIAFESPEEERVHRIVTRIPLGRAAPPRVLAGGIIVPWEGFRQAAYEPNAVEDLGGTRDRCRVRKYRRLAFDTIPASFRAACDAFEASAARVELAGPWHPWFVLSSTGGTTPDTAALARQRYAALPRVAAFKMLAPLRTRDSGREVAALRAMTARAAARVVRLEHAYVDHSGELTLVLECCAGGTMDGFLLARAQRLSAETQPNVGIPAADAAREARKFRRICITLLIQVARGLVELHTAGWAHGDVKPDNVLLRVPVVDDASPPSVAPATAARALDSVFPTADPAGASHGVLMSTTAAQDEQREDVASVDACIGDLGCACRFASDEDRFRPIEFTGAYAPPERLRATLHPTMQVYRGVQRIYVMGGAAPQPLRFDPDEPRPPPPPPPPAVRAVVEPTLTAEAAQRLHLMDEANAGAHLPRDNFPSAAADIWALGVVLFRVVVGYCPFAASAIAAADARRPVAEFLTTADLMSPPTAAKQVRAGDDDDARSSRRRARSTESDDDEMANEAALMRSHRGPPQKNTLASILRAQTDARYFMRSCVFKRFDRACRRGGWDPRLSQLLRQCLSVDPARRPSAAEALQHLEAAVA
jgi:serine/threonine protein kinase